MITESDLNNWFTYHPPTGDQIEKYAEIRLIALRFAQVILRNTPPSADQTTAIRKIREAVMTANAAIACDDRSIINNEMRLKMNPVDVPINCDDL